MRNEKGYFISVIYLLLFVLGVSGCTSQTSETEKLPGIDVEMNKINTDFIIYEDPVGGNANSHTNNEFLSVAVINFSNAYILFSPGYVNIFAKIDNKWNSINNAINYPNFDQSLPPAKVFPPGMNVVVIPAIPNMTKPTLIRIFFEGRIENTNEKVGAYMDVTLLP